MDPPADRTELPYWKTRTRDRRLWTVFCRVSIRARRRGNRPTRVYPRSVSASTSSYRSRCRTRTLRRQELDRWDRHRRVRAAQCSRKRTPRAAAGSPTRKSCPAAPGRLLNGQISDLVSSRFLALRNYEPGYIQSPRGNLARTSTLPYRKPKLLFVSILPDITGGRMYAPLASRRQSFDPYSAVHLLSTFKQNKKRYNINTSHNLVRRVTSGFWMTMHRSLPLSRLTIHND